jgi:hypothetical protein
MRVEKGLPVTYFFIPFKCRAGHGLGHANARRATKYDVTDIPEWISVLAAEGCEIAVHGIDAWHDVHAARSERARVADVAQAPVAGIRMHWLLRDAGTFEVLGEAGYSYDSTAGYNETVGYRLGTTQVCRPSRSPRLLELPLHIQDGALFYPGKLGLSEAEAWEICKELIGNAEKWGGVLTILWHDRSHGPERFWGDFYFRLIEELRRANPWFAKGSQAVDWFRKRRAIRFAEITTADGSDAIGLFCEEGTVEPAFSVRCWRGAIGTHTEEIERFHETPWSGLDPMMLPSSRGKSGSGGTRATHDIR